MKAVNDWLADLREIVSEPLPEIRCDEQQVLFQAAFACVFKALHNDTACRESKTHDLEEAEGG